MNFINYLEKITGVDVYGIASFMIFFFFFIIMSVWAWRADKGLIDVMKQIPLDKTEVNT